MAEEMHRLLLTNDYHRPTLCRECGGVMVYRGVGEYRCEDCGILEYDDYGKVRNYLEKNKGANVAEISDHTGVSHKAIREMIKEKRFEVLDNRGGYIRCEMCGVDIKSGRLCSKCEMAYHRKLEEKARSGRQKSMAGYGESVRGESGSKRYTRER